MLNKLLALRHASPLSSAFLVGFFLILVLPLLNLPPLFSPPDWGKTIVFKIVISILLLLFFTQLLDQEYKTSIVNRARMLFARAKLPLILLSIFSFLLLVSTIFSVDRTLSFWGDPMRSGGFLNLVFYFIFGALALLGIKGKDWNKLWNGAIVGGIGVAFVAFFQQFNLFSVLFITTSARPPSTLGGALFLGAYMLLLLVITVSLLFHEVSKKKQLFYFLSAVLFVLALFISGSRSAYLGLFFATLYFVFLFPSAAFQAPRAAFVTPKLIRTVKILLVAVCLLSATSLYLVNQYPEQTKTSIDSIQNQSLQTVTNNIVGRLSFATVLREPRLSAWRVGMEAMQDRPLLGYGIENFSVGFDQFFDPSFSNFESKILTAPTNWWDRAHNVFLEVGVSAGIPALLIYIGFFSLLFYLLQKLKRRSPSEAIVAHGMQTTFLAYFIVNFLGFDTFSTYIIITLVIVYALVLVAKAQETSSPLAQPKLSTLLTNASRSRLALLSIFFLLVLFFSWQHNLRPLLANAKINTAKFYVSHNRCEPGYRILDSVLASENSPFNTYARTSYVDLLTICNTVAPQERIITARKGSTLLKESVKSRPLYTRNWIFLGGFSNVLLQAELLKAPGLQSQRTIEQKKKDAHSYFSIAHDLSPKRQEIYVEWIKTFLITQDYGGAKQKAQECIDLNPDHDTCAWLKQVAEIYTGDRAAIELGSEADPRFNVQLGSPAQLSQLVRAYAITKNSEQIINVYQRLVEFDPLNKRMHASLAAAYQEGGYYGRAHQEAFRVLDLDPSSQKVVETFLQALPPPYQGTERTYENPIEPDPESYQSHVISLRYASQKLVEEDPQNSQAYLSLAFAYREHGCSGCYVWARRYALDALELNPALKKTVEEFLLILPPSSS